MLCCHFVSVLLYYQIICLSSAICGSLFVYFLFSCVSIVCWLIVIDSFVLFILGSFDCLFFFVSRYASHGLLSFFLIRLFFVLVFECVFCLRWQCFCTWHALVSR